MAKNRKFGKSVKELRQDRTVKVLTFTPLAGNRYKCNQTGKRKRQSEILSHIMEFIHGHKTTIIRRG